MDDFVNRMDAKVDSVNERLAHIEGMLEQWKVNIDRFYQKDMSQLIQTVSENQKQIAKLDVEMAKLKTQVAIWGSLGILIASLLMNIVFQFFTTGPK